MQTTLSPSETDLDLETDRDWRFLRGDLDLDTDRERDLLRGDLDLDTDGEHDFDFDPAREERDLDRDLELDLEALLEDRLALDDGDRARACLPRLDCLPWRSAISAMSKLIHDDIKYMQYKAINKLFIKWSKNQLTDQIYFNRVSKINCTLDIITCARIMWAKYTKNIQFYM